MKSTILPLFATLGLMAGCAAQPEQVAATDAAAQEQCAQQFTGSRIRSADNTRCAPQGYPSRSYTAEELATTGEMDMSEALRKLDPTFR
jgi:uncharacterized lipoprotein YajG